MLHPLADIYNLSALNLIQHIFIITITKSMVNVSLRFHNLRLVFAHGVVIPLFFMLSYKRQCKLKLIHGAALALYPLQCLPRTSFCDAIHHVLSVVKYRNCKRLYEEFWISQVCKNKPRSPFNTTKLSICLFCFFLVPGLIGTLQAAEVIKLLTGVGGTPFSCSLSMKLNSFPLSILSSVCSTYLHPS